MTDNENTPTDRETETAPPNAQKATLTAEQVRARQRLSAELTALDTQTHSDFDPNEALKRELIVKKALAAQLLACEKRVQEAQSAVKLNTQVRELALRKALKLSEGEIAEVEKAETEKKEAKGEDVKKQKVMMTIDLSETIAFFKEKGLNDKAYIEFLERVS